MAVAVDVLLADTRERNVGRDEQDCSTSYLTEPSDIAPGNTVRVNSPMTSSPIRRLPPP